MNLLLLRRPKPAAVRPGTCVSILIPARNEEANIAEAIETALASEGVDIEVVIMDDGSTDRTVEIAGAFAARDSRVRIEHAPPLPAGWTGKVHACQRLAEAARGTHFLFVDADVRLAPDAAASLVRHAQASGSGMVSGVPRQLMGSFGEFMTVPMINFLMLGYLPILGMRTSIRPGFGAACGQLVLVERGAYESVGGHESIRDRLHDGIQLARRFRHGGHMTDLVAAAELASCRMYNNFEDAWAGFIKNAHEGMATPTQLPVWTILLGLGHVLPLPLLIAALFGLVPIVPAAWAVVLSFGLRAAVTLSSRESLWSIPLHPATVAVGLAIQWTSLLRSRSGRPAGWKGRLYPAE